MSKPMSLHLPENVFRCCLKALLPFLKEFVCSHLERHYGHRCEEYLKPPGRNKPVDSDPRAFLSTAIVHWKDAFQRDVPKSVNNHLHEISDIANRQAHFQPVSDEEYQHAIDAIRLLAKKIGGDTAISAIDDCSSRPPPPGEQICPACKTKIFKRWPWGWDAHAAYKCSGLTGTDPEARKKEFRSRFANLFP